MADIIVQIVPLVAGREPSKFKTQRQPRIPAVIASLVEEHGAGVLKDSDGATILADQDDLLEAGNYTFTLSSTLSGNQHMPGAVFQPSA